MTRDPWPIDPFAALLFVVVLGVLILTAEGWVRYWRLRSEVAVQRRHLDRLSQIDHQNMLVYRDQYRAAATLAMQWRAEGRLMSGVRAADQLEAAMREAHRSPENSEEGRTPGSPRAGN